MEEFSKEQCEATEKYVYEMECIEVKVTSITLDGPTNDPFSATDELNLKFYCEQDEDKVFERLGVVIPSAYSTIDFELQENEKHSTSITRDCVMGKPIVFHMTEEDLFSDDYGEVKVLPQEYLMAAANGNAMEVRLQARDPWADAI